MEKALGFRGIGGKGSSNLSARLEIISRFVTAAIFILFCKVLNCFRFMICIVFGSRQFLNYILWSSVIFTASCMLWYSMLTFVFASFHGISQVIQFSRHYE